MKYSVCLTDAGIHIKRHIEAESFNFLVVQINRRKSKDIFPYVIVICDLFGKPQTKKFLKLKSSIVSFVKNHTGVELADEHFEKIDALLLARKLIDGK